jgi:peptidyl-prolyl cis-trans isomerase B (cyclophilin B)
MSVLLTQLPSVALVAAVLLQAAPKPAPDPFSSATVAELRSYRATLETAKGKITLAFLPDKAPETVRNFLRLAAAEVYDNTLVHRVLPGNLIQTGAPFFRSLPLSGRQRRLVHDLKPEYNDTKFVAGIVGMAHGDERNEAAQTSFFICTGLCKEFDGKYTAFARVVDGMAVAKAIEKVPLNGERPKEKIYVVRVTVARVAGLR